MLLSSNDNDFKKTLRKTLCGLLAAMLFIGAFAVPAVADESISDELLEIETAEEMSGPAEAEEMSGPEETAEMSEKSDAEEIDEVSTEESNGIPMDKDITDEPAAITGFAPFDITGHYLYIDRGERPSLEELTAMMPETLDAYLNGSETAECIPVSWYCVDDDFETTELYYVQFSPVFNENYKAAEDLDILTEAPYIGVFLTEGGADRLMGAADPAAVGEDMDSAETAGMDLAGEEAFGEDTLNTAQKTYTSSPYELKIFNYLVKNLKYSTAAAVGIMTNIYCESSFYPNNLQNNGNKALGMTDDQYTNAVDNGTYKNFVYDKYGYGLIQWTWWSRKQNLYNYKVKCGTSIGDYVTQLNFMQTELAGSQYAELRAALANAAQNEQGAYNAAHAWCYHFEKPGNYPAVSVTRGNLAKNTFWPIYKAAQVTYSTTYERISGDSRYATAIAAADTILKLRGKTSFDTIVLASATNYPDALSGTALAGKHQAPILLANAAGTGDGTKKTIDYIKKHLSSSGKVYILGGEAAVGLQTEETIRNSGFEVVRLGGESRYATNLLIVEEMAVEPGADVYIATGKNFADALSVSAISAVTGGPVILTSDKLTQEALDKIAEIKPANIYILGGKAAVTAAAEEQLKTLVADLAAAEEPVKVQLKRLEGDSRYTTSVKIAETLAASKPATAVIATGKNFPDGLVAGLLAAEKGSPVLLVSEKTYSPAAKYAAAKGIMKFTIMGGTAAVPESAVLGLMR